MTLLEKLLKLMEEQGRTQAGVERAVALPQNRISKWKDGNGEPTAVQALRLARLFGVSAEWLIDDTQEFPAPRARPRSDDEETLRSVVRALGLSTREAIQALSGGTEAGRDPDPVETAPAAESDRPRRSGYWAGGEAQHMTDSFLAQIKQDERSKRDAARRKSKEKRSGKKPDGESGTLKVKK